MSFVPGMISTRKAQANDEATFYQFICALEEKALDRDIFSRLYALNLDKPNIYLVAEHEGEPAGILTCHVQHLLHHEGPVYEIQELYVAEPFRSRGIGHTLLAKLFELLRKREIDTLEVSSNIRRTRAHEFYTREGFTGSHSKFTYSFNLGRHL